VQPAVCRSVPPSLVSELRKAVARAEGYIRSRQSDNGGFCFYRTDYVDEPNLHDTYYAVAALKLLGAEVARKDRLVQFVDGFPLWGLNYLYHYAFTLDLLGQDRIIDKDRLARIHSLTIAAPQALRSGQTRAWLEDALMTLQLRRRFAEIAEYPEVAHLINSLNRGGGYGAKPNLWDTYLSLSILEALGKYQPKEETLRFVEEQQVPSLGFALSEDSLMANLEVLHAGVKCCALLGVPVKYGADVLAAVMCCQASDGGFARAPTALPDLKLTYRGLKVIALVAPELLPIGSTHAKRTPNS
jgi:hypothetical protein